MVQAGIPDRKMKDATDPTGLDLGTFLGVKNLSKKYIVLTMTAFTVLLVGLAMSIVTFGTEIFTHYFVLHECIVQSRSS